VFDRVLTIDPDNAKVLAILDGINRRRKLRGLAVAMLAAGTLAGGAVMLERNLRPVPMQVAVDPADRVPPIHVRQAAGGSDDEPPAVDAAVVASADATLPDTRVATAPTVPNDAPPPTTVDPTPIKIVVNPHRGSEIKIGDLDWQPVPASGEVTATIAKDTVIKARNACCTDKEKTVHVGQPEESLDLENKPGGVMPKCELPGVTVTVDGRDATLGDYATVFFPGYTADRKVVVQFSTKEKIITKDVRLRPGQLLEVPCAP
jgi:hypothetical protein